jgi:hypothetical protein
VRIPIRSEREAFRLTVAGAVVIAVAVLIGWLTEPVVGVAVFLLAFVLAAIAYLRAPNPDRHTPLREAAHEAHPHGAPAATRRVLVVANEALSGSELRERILGRDRGRTEVDILVPVLTSHLHYGVSDIDRELEQARARLEISLAWAREQGIIARGEVGDPSPTSAIEDELRDFGADEVIVVTHPSERETWQERGELERLRHELDLPVTLVVVGDHGASADLGSSEGAPPSPGMRRADGSEPANRLQPPH